MHRIDADAYVAGNLFSDGNPTTGQPGTKVDAAWFNAVQEEVCHAIEAAGLTLNKADDTQLSAAILAQIAKRANLPSVGQHGSSAASFSTAGTSYIDATGLTVTLPATTGRPVAIALQPSGGGVASLLAWSNTGYAGLQIALLRDGAIIAETQLANAIGVSGTTGAISCPLGQFYLDAAASAGAHTYKIQLKSLGGNGGLAVWIYNAVLVAYEL